MNQILQQITQTLQAEMDSLSNQVFNKINLANQAIPFHHKCLTNLKLIVTSNKFKTPIDEINFFKYTKPQILGKMIFYKRLINIESRCPLADQKLKKQFLRAEIAKVQSFFNENIDFYAYINMDSDHLDHVYFLRDQIESQHDADEWIYCDDPQFTTGFDIKVALIKANEFAMHYLNEQLLALKPSDPNNLSASNIAWSESKAALVELIYAIHSARCLNNGNADIKVIAVFFEDVFNIKLGDYYHHFLQIKARNNPTKFIDHMRAALIQRINDSNE